MTVATPSLVGGTWTILQARLRVARNTFWRGKITRKIATVLVAGFVVAASYGLFRFTRFIVRVLRQLPQEMPELAAQLESLDQLFAAVPSFALGVFALPLLLTSVSFALSTLYLARDLDTLLVTPVPVRSVFLARFLEGLVPTYLLLFVLLAPALAGYGQALGYSPAYYLALLLVLALLPLLPISIGTLLTMLLVRIISPKRLRDVLTVVGALFGLAVYIGSQLFVQATEQLATPEAATQLLRFDTSVLPTSWGARALIAAGTYAWGELLLYGGAYIAATAGLFTICLALAERLYYIGWVSMAGSGGGKVRRRTRQATGAWLLSGPVGAIVRKDLRVLPRDLQQLSQLLMPLAFSVFWVWRLVSDSQLNEASSKAPAAIANAGLVGLGIFVCIMITSNLGLRGVNREGQGYWLLHLAPISPWTVLWAKWSVAWLPFPILGTLFVALIGVLQQPPLGQLLQDWLLYTMTGIGVAGITVGLGAAFPKFDWQQPNNMTSARSGCIGSVLYLIYAALMLGVTIGAQFVAPQWGGWVYGVGWGLALVLTALALWLPLQLGATRLRNLAL